MFVVGKKENDDDCVRKIIFIYFYNVNCNVYFLLKLYLSVLIFIKILCF